MPAVRVRCVSCKQTVPIDQSICGRLENALYRIRQLEARAVQAADR